MIQYCLLLSCMLLVQDTYASSLLKDISSWFSQSTSWITRTKESLLFQEEEVSPDCHITIEHTNGPIFIKGWSLSKIALEAIKKGSEFDIENMSIDTNFQNSDKIIIKTNNTATNVKGSIEYRLLVPQQASLTIINGQGAIKIKKVTGTMNIITNKGTVTVHDAQQSINIKTPQDIVINYRAVPLNSSSLLETVNGNITVAFPESSHIDLVAKTLHGYVFSEHYVSLKPLTIKLNQQAWTRLQREVHGAIGNGGAYMHLASRFGTIKLLEY